MTLSLMELFACSCHNNQTLSQFYYLLCFLSKINYYLVIVSIIIITHQKKRSEGQTAIANIQQNKEISHTH